VRARSRQQLPLKLHEFEQREAPGTGGRFLGPTRWSEYNGRPLVDALKTIMVGVRFQRTARAR
jgi:hypothetical protein